MPPTIKTDQSRELLIKKTAPRSDKREREEGLEENKERHQGKERRRKAEISRSAGGCLIYIKKKENKRRKGEIREARK